MKNKVINSYNKLQGDEYFQNLIAQSYSRAILRDINEPIVNYPNYEENLDYKLLMIVQLYFNIAFQISDDTEDEVQIKIKYDSLKSSADILKNIYYYSETASEKDYYLLISSMAYYVANDFSKSYALLKNHDNKNKISKIIGLFLRKDYQGLFMESWSVQDDIKESENDELENDTYIYIRILSKTMINYLNFLVTGDDKYINNSIESVTDLIILSEIDKDVLSWYIFKLLKLMFEKFYKVSLWNVVPPLIGNYNEVIEKYILNNLLNRPSIVELFPLQIEALNASMNESGSVISIPTSSGKTKIAELNILKTLNIDSNAIILYLAPFKSLAYEVESSLSKNLGKINIDVSNMYADRTESLFDTFLQDESQVLIMTPEKAKMMLRNNEEIKNRTKLVILDEGHLIGGDLRFTRNEIFYEELRYYVKKTEGKFMVLSAVLPNTEHIAEWLNGSSKHAFSSSESINEKRFGLLIYNNDNSVTIKWRGRNNPYNHNFVNRIFVSKRKIMPRNKREAIILSAINFSESDKVLVYLSRKNMIKGYIKNFYLIIDYLEDNKWNNIDEWKNYKGYIETYYGEDSMYTKLAEKGIIIHHASLPNNVRIATERLLRNSNPKIIIATSTLAQGVNIGVSTIIIGNYYPAQYPISKSEFNNIIGRAGRSFIDIEGKILFPIDTSKGSWKNKQEIKRFENYIDDSVEEVESGIYYVLRQIYQLSLEADINFETLLDLISNNERFETDINLYLLDDTLLALLNEENFEVENLDEIIRSSFSYLLAINKAEKFNAEKLQKMILARAKFIKIAYQDSDKTDLYIKAGVGINFVKFLEEYQQSIENILVNKQYSEELISLLVNISNSESNIYRDDRSLMDHEKINLWLSGERIGEEDFVNFNWGKFDYELPLIINTLSKIFLMNKKEDLSIKLLEFNECIKYGVPNISAVKLYIIGINSREAVTKISKKYMETIASFDNQSLLKLFMLNKYDEIYTEFKEYDFYPVINAWYENNTPSIKRNKNGKNLTLKIRHQHIPYEIKQLRLMRRENKIYLASLDLEYKMQIDEEKISFDNSIINNYFYYFERTDKETFVLRKPNL